MRYGTIREEWPEGTLVFGRRPGRCELVLVHPVDGREFIIPVGAEQAAGLAAFFGAATHAEVNKLMREIASRE